MFQVAKDQIKEEILQYVIFAKVDEQYNRTNILLNDDIWNKIN